MIENSDVKTISGIYIYQTYIYFRKISMGKIKELLNNFDQLNKARRKREAFSDFSEAPISFPPTYRILVSVSFIQEIRKSIVTLCEIFCDKKFLENTFLCFRTLQNQIFIIKSLLFLIRKKCCLIRRLAPRNMIYCGFHRGVIVFCSRGIRCLVNVMNRIS